MAVPMEKKRFLQAISRLWCETWLIRLALVGVSSPTVDFEWVDSIDTIMRRQTVRRQIQLQSSDKCWL